MAETKPGFLSDSQVQQGLREVASNVAIGRPGLFLSRSATGYVLISGAVATAVRVGDAGGHMIAIGLNDEGLRALRARIDSLLGEKTQAPLPAGMVLG